MSLTSPLSMNARFGIFLFAIVASSIYAQQTPTAPQPPQAQQPATAQTGQPDQSAQSPQAVQPQAKRPPEEPYIIEDGGLSIEPLYWLNRAQPTLNGGATTTGLSGS